MKIYTDKRLLSAGFVGGTLSRHSGNMRDLSLQARAYQELGIDPQKILHFHQIHSDKWLTVHTADEAQALLSAPLHDADAWLLSPIPAGWGAAILTADCVPLFLWDGTGTHAALAHCGWRGVAQGLPGKIAKALAEHAKAPLNAWLGPHIQACCFEVQQDVADQFPPDSHIHKEGRLYVDLNKAIIAQLAQAGVNQADVHAPYYCTCGDKENFFSWRRDHQKDLLLSFIYKP
ncbi:MAG: polyphenol oxidase family protein [Elusimicrobiaceae bacterium]|nr:polyphenol oxidase family protein [Elusimicrobiaceae bacterium]